MLDLSGYEGDTESTKPGASQSRKHSQNTITTIIVALSRSTISDGALRDS